ncbi:hypothetical protein [Microbacterium karelineae]|uniref:hypothetical protein n=1 Tax=Microbacterium karelineae TaxID=2654283 RepID=UPI0012EA66B4|nr:hypothetical protein [Microbacterium karelineae]
MSTHTRRTAPAWFTATIAGIFGLFYAYAIWAGISYLVVMAQTASAIGGSLTPVSWIAMIMTIIVPIATFVIAVLIGRGREAWKLILMLLVGLAVTAVFWLNVQGFTATQVVFQ